MSVQPDYPGAPPIPDPEELPLADFERDVRAQLKRIRESGRPAVLTRDGYAEAVVLDVELYERLMEAWDDADTEAGVLRGLLDEAHGEVIPLEDMIPLEEAMKPAPERERPRKSA